MIALALSRRQRGVGMMEVLAAMFVLSVGLLGVAALQSQGIRAGHAASLRSVAVFKAEEMIERMRGNPDGVLDPLGATSYDSAASDVGEDHQCDDVAGNNASACTAANLARHDIFRWKQSLGASLPGAPVGIIAVNTANRPPVVTVTVQWTERGDPQQYVTVAQVQ